MEVATTISKINYRIHTDAIKENLVPRKYTITGQPGLCERSIYLNVALFGLTEKNGGNQNPEENGNTREYAVWSIGGC